VWTCYGPAPGLLLVSAHIRSDAVAALNARATH